MTVRIRILISFLLCAVVGTLAWQMFRPRMPDPVFESQHLSYWVGRSDGTESLTAEAAVRAAALNLRVPPHRVYIEPFAGIPELIKALNDP